MVTIFASLSGLTGKTVHCAVCNASLKSFYKDVENEFRRYAAVINDPNTPVGSLQVIVNIQEASAFFESLLSKYNIPGLVIVSP